MSTTNASRKETERTKLIQEKCQTLLTQMLRDEDNKYCVDCDAKGPRWASWNIGVFLCIRCAGIHRNLGVHISRVKSVNLDTWTPEQVISLQQMGNSRARAVYEAQLPDGFRRPQTDNALESFVRAKYEHKKYLAREWVPPSPPKVDWAKEIDEELERQKRKKKAAQASNALGIGVLSGGSGGDKKSTTAGGNAAMRSVPLPAPLPKPKAGQSGSSPKTQRLSAGAISNFSDQQNDLLGLSTPTKPMTQDCLSDSGAQDLQNDSFSSFLSAPVMSDGGTTDSNKTVQNSLISNSGTAGSSTSNALAKEEQDFFNHGSLGTNDKDKSGKLTKDSILALYSAAPTNPHNPQQLHFGTQQVVGQQYTPNSFGGSAGISVGHNSINFTGMSPGFMGGVSGALTQQQQQQHNPQFMTPPNSASMYNAPVMTAPTAFSTTGIGGGLHLGNAVMPSAAGGFGAQFPGMPHVGYPAQMQSAGIMPQHMMTLGGSIMATGQTTTASSTPQLMHSNNSRLGGLPFGMVPGVMSQPTMQQLPPNSLSGMHSMSAAGGGSGMPIMGMGGNSGNLGTFQATAAGNAIGPNANLSQQFGNLNIGNVWQ